jgi:hypothetical protein
MWLKTIADAIHGNRPVDGRGMDSALEFSKPLTRTIDIFVFLMLVHLIFRNTMLGHPIAWGYGLTLVLYSLAISGLAGRASGIRMAAFGMLAFSFAIVIPYRTGYHPLSTGHLAAAACICLYLYYGMKVAFTAIGVYCINLAFLMGIGDRYSQTTSPLRLLARSGCWVSR